MVGMPAYKHFLRFAAVIALAIAIAHNGLADIVGIGLAHAQAIDPSGAAITSLNFIVGIMISVMNFLMWFLFMMLDHVMNPDWIFDLNANGSDGALLNMLREIWQLSRDLVNLGLALFLIFEAIVMIVTADSSKVKAALPKFVAALVLVNFSWFLPRVLFDVSQVLTYTVYEIPSLLHADGCTVPPGPGQAGPQPCVMVTNYAFFDDTFLIDNNGNGPNGTTGWTCAMRPLVCVQMAPYDSPQALASSQMHSKVINGLIINHARLRNLVSISNPPLGALGGKGGIGFRDVAVMIAFLVKMIVILLFHVALFFPVLALTAAFFIRIPVLWVTMAFMPFAALGFVIGDKLGEFDPKKIFMDEFLKVVFLPAKVAVPFTIGFIMVNAGAQTVAPAGLNGLGPIAIFTGVRDLWQIIWMMIALFIIWKYSFQALKSGGEAVNHFTDKIKGFGESSLQLATKYPLSLPFIPGPGGGKNSLLDYSRVLNPRDALADINSGQTPKLFTERLKQLANARKGAGPPPVERVADKIKTKTDIAIKNEITTKITAAGDAGVDDLTRLKNLREAVEKFRATHAAEAGHTNKDTVEGLIKGLGLDAAKAEKIRELIVKLPGA